MNHAVAQRVQKVLRAISWRCARVKVCPTGTSTHDLVGRAFLPVMLAIEGTDRNVCSTFQTRFFRVPHKSISPATRDKCAPSSLPVNPSERVALPEPMSHWPPPAKGFE